MNRSGPTKGYSLSGDRSTALLTKPTPTPGTCQVLIRSRGPAICGTNLHLYRENVTARAAYARNYPGHEPVGDVVAVGDDMAWPPVGDRVVGDPVIGCDDCDFCRNRDCRLCHHALDPENIVGSHTTARTKSVCYIPSARSFRCRMTSPMRRRLGPRLQFRHCLVRSPQVAFDEDGVPAHRLRGHRRATGVNEL